MPSLAKFTRAGLMAFALVAAAGAAAAYEQVQADVDSAGGGVLQGGAYTAFTTIATIGDAAPMQGGVFEVTSGLERRHDAVLGTAIFADGFEQ